MLHNSNHMKTSPVRFFSIFLSFTYFTHTHCVLPFTTTTAAAADDCLPSSCSPTGPQIRSPFRLAGRQPIQCGFPRFTLTCDSQNQTVYTLPSSKQSVIVEGIDYSEQMISIDPGFCTPARISGFDLAGTPFDLRIMKYYSFFNCSGGQHNPSVVFPCLSGANYTVIAIRSPGPGDAPENCRRFATVSVPLWSYTDLRGRVELKWFTPLCQQCETEGKSCRVQGNDGETGCSASSSAGLPRGAKYGMIIGIGIPGLVCIIGLLCYASNKLRDYTRQYQQSIDLFSIAITPQPTSSTGLDWPTIESYPKTVLGESCRLPKPSDGTCPICLSDYQPKEELRTIPECNHYFHAECIDEWLKLNGTCPVCRNSPESSSLVTPCSSMSSNSSTSS